MGDIERMQCGWSNSAMGLLCNNRAGAKDSSPRAEVVAFLGRAAKSHPTAQNSGGLQRSHSNHPGNSTLWGREESEGKTKRATLRFSYCLFLNWYWPIATHPLIPHTAGDTQQCSKGRKNTKNTNTQCMTLVFKNR